MFTIWVLLDFSSLLDHINHGIKTFHLQRFLVHYMFCFWKHFWLCHFVVLSELFLNDRISITFSISCETNWIIKCRACLVSQDCFINLVLLSIKVPQMFVSKIFVLVVSVADFKILCLFIYLFINREVCWKP